MTSLALDLGTTFGWAKGFKEGESGKVKLPGANRHLGRRFSEFSKWLDDNLDGVDSVYYERNFHRGFADGHVHGGFKCILYMKCYERGINPRNVHSASLKAYATGKGNAKKSAMVFAAKDRLGLSVPDDNQCDAVWILHYFTKGPGSEE